MTVPLYSPDFVPCDFWLFPKLNSPLKRKRFHTVDEIQENMIGQLMAIPTKDFAGCFEQWRRWWENCVRSQGAYFEGDRDVIVLCTMFLYPVSSSNVSVLHNTWLDTSWTYFSYVWVHGSPGEKKMKSAQWAWRMELATYTCKLPGNANFTSFPIYERAFLTKAVCSAELSAFQNKTEKPKMGSRKGQCCRKEAPWS